MPEKESHTIRNGIVATVAGGLILSAIQPLREFVLTCLAWVWAKVILMWSAVIASHFVPGWVLALLGLLAFIGLINLYLALRPKETADYKKYTEDEIYGAKWRWSWIDNKITNLWCYCPRCDAQLVYNDSSCRDILSPIYKTDFICENCGNQVVASINGGNKLYALGAAEREIFRRIRTKVHVHSNN